jgi:carbonic anhydrase
MFNPAHDTLTGQMVGYSMNGYDWPLTCKTGLEQSPVDLSSGFASVNTSLAIRAKAFETITAGTMNKRATHMALNLPNGQFDIIDPMGEYTEYTPYEAVVRSPSEHTVDGLTYDAEL